MNLSYPIKALLIYIATLFAPADVNRITLEGLPDNVRPELVRDEGNWKCDGAPVSVEGDQLVVHGPSGKKTMKITDFAVSPRGNDWTKTPVFTLADSTTLRKTDAGFTLERKSKDGEANGIYQIRYARPAAGGQNLIKVSVLGKVMNPGIHQIPPGASLVDAIVAAGGIAGGADRKNISIVRGPAGAVPKVTHYDFAAILGGTIVNPLIEPRDTIHVPAMDPADPDAPPVEKVVVLADKWLAGIDAGNFAKSWKDAAGFFQKSITEAAWSEALAKVRKPLGELKSRKLLDTQSAKSLPGSPDGEYVVLQFDTSFTAKEKAVETVTFMKEPDGTWKAVGYFIK